MSIAIDREKCKGCGACAEVCPGTLIRLVERTDEIEKRNRLNCQNKVTVLDRSSVSETQGEKVIGPATQKESKKLAELAYPRDCWGCCSCLKACHFGAIALYLGADLGGLGGKMTVSEKDDKLYWNISRRNGTIEQVVTNRKEANQY